MLVKELKGLALDVELSGGKPEGKKDEDGEVGASLEAPADSDEREITIR